MNQPRTAHEFAADSGVRYSICCRCSPHCFSFVETALLIQFCQLSHCPLGGVIWSHENFKMALTDGEIMDVRR